MTGVTDEALALRAAGGDREAFGTLFERHYDRVFRVGVRMLGDSDEAQDVAQDVWIELPARLSSWRREGRFVHWLYRVAVNATHDALRKRSTRSRHERSYAEVETLRQAGAAARAGESAWLQRALDELPESLRMTVVLVIDQNLRHADAGEVLGVSEATVSWRMHEVRKRLRALAEKSEGQG